MRAAPWYMAALLSTAAAGVHADQGQGFTASPDSLWPRWQGRVALGTPSPLSHADTMNIDGSGSSVRAATVLGDYYFARLLNNKDSGSGFRATSGVFFGARSSSLLSTAPTSGLGTRAFSVDRRSSSGLIPPTLETPTDLSAVPYLGLGYTSTYNKSGWGFSADLGLMALNPGALRFGTTPSLDDQFRDMRLSPLVQFGVSYSF